MSPAPLNVAILGSTGSIGRSTLDVIAGSEGRMRAVGLAAHSRTGLLRQQAARFLPKQIVITDHEAAAGEDWSDLPSHIRLAIGPQALPALAADPEVDVVVSAIVGRAGLEGTWAALEAGKRVALANKETLVVGGPLVMRLARQHHAVLLPVDSEHSAVFQALQAGKKDEVRRIILTASGGPFRTHRPEQLAEVTVAEALAHPTWNMGPKITIDSATLMNKALEIIEARWLFDLPAEQISVVIHPQSIVHSMVEYVDGSVIAQLSPPDMRLPIQYALTWPARLPGVAPRLDLSQAMQLQFEPATPDRYPAIGLGLEVARVGGTAGAVLNGANEAAVNAFLNGELAFPEIVPACRDVLNHHHFIPEPTLDELLQADRWARQEVSRWVCT